MRSLISAMQESAKHVARRFIGTSAEVGTSANTPASTAYRRTSAMNNPTTTRPQDVELLPCPFCGGTPRFLEHHSGFYEEAVICDTCHIAHRGFGESRTRWNTRANVSAALAAAQVREEELLEEVERWKSLHATAYDAFRTGVATERRLEAQAERLAEALRGAADEIDKLGGDAYAIRALTAQPAAGEPGESNHG
jgi:hypothetical protein